MASERKLKTLTLAEKGKLLDAIENGTKMCDAAEQFVSIIYMFKVALHCLSVILSASAACQVHFC